MGISYSYPVVRVCFSIKTWQFLGVSLQTRHWYAPITFSECPSSLFFNKGAINLCPISSNYIPVVWLGHTTPLQIPLQIAIVIFAILDVFHLRLLSTTRFDMPPIVI